MIDLHCHILPGIDDGAQNLHEALTLARIAANDGITHAAVTPHIHPGRYENARQNILGQLELFSSALAEAGIPLSLSAGAEVRISAEIITMLANNSIPFLGEVDGYRIMLLELPHSHILPGADKLVQFLLKENIRPLIAHPERNKDVVRNIDKIKPFIDAGCWLQLTAASVTGKFGSACEHTAKQMLEHDWVEVIATDAHNEQHRPPVLSECHQLISEWQGNKVAEDLFFNNPRKIIQHALIYA